MTSPTTAALLARQLGDTSPQGFALALQRRALLAIQPAPHVRFSARATDTDGAAVAHVAGVNALGIDAAEGAANGQIALWDLDQCGEPEQRGRPSELHKPIGVVERTAAAHKFGITTATFYPVDSGAFLTSSYDHTLKIFSAESLAPAASFDLGAVVYAHAQPARSVPQHLLVACGTQHPAVRLVDLRSGAAGHALAGHAGTTVLSVAWCPRDDNILASAGSDGRVRLWDIRRSAASLGVLDVDDALGLGPIRGQAVVSRRRERGTSHAGPANGVVWTQCGRYIVSTGHDERMRVWDARTGANTLVNFGPLVRNRHFSTLLPLVVPWTAAEPGKGAVFFPNEREILMFELLEGSLIKRLKVPFAPQRDPSLADAGTDDPKTGVDAHRNVRSRTTMLMWRPHHVEMLSSHTDGTIRSWRPRTTLDALIEDDDDDAKLRGGAHSGDGHGDVAGSKRKRQTLDEIYQDLTTVQQTFI